MSTLSASLSYSIYSLHFKSTYNWGQRSELQSSASIFSYNSFLFTSCGDLRRSRLGALTLAALSVQFVL